MVSQKQKVVDTFIHRNRTRVVHLKNGSDCFNGCDFEPIFVYDVLQPDCYIVSMSFKCDIDNVTYSHLCEITDQ